jgi:hypothetical protein
VAHPEAPVLALLSSNPRNQTNTHYIIISFLNLF